MMHHARNLLHGFIIRSDYKYYLNFFSGEYLAKYMEKSVLTLVSSKVIDLYLLQTELSQDSAISIATDYRLDDRGVRAPVGLRIFSSPHCPALLWCPLSLPSDGYWGLFSWG
jgi:hypothetical protein